MTTDSNLVESGTPNEPTDNARQRLTQNVSQNIQTTRRSNLRRKLVIPVLFTLLFVMVVALGHDLFVKRQFTENMIKLRQQLNQYNETNGKYPDQETFLDFDLNSRNMRIEYVHYDIGHILEDSPATTVLAHVMADLRILPAQHMVLLLNGNIEWVSPEALSEMLEERDKFYNSRILRTN